MRSHFETEKWVRFLTVFLFLGVEIRDRRPAAESQPAAGRARPARPPGRPIVARRSIGRPTARSVSSQIRKQPRNREQAHNKKQEADAHIVAQRAATLNEAVSFGSP